MPPGLAEDTQERNNDVARMACSRDIPLLSDFLIVRNN
jgi:hypothetical protein